MGRSELASEGGIVPQLASRLKGKVILFLTALLSYLGIRVRKSKTLLAAAKHVC